MASNYHFWKKEAEELDRGGHICLQPELCYGDVRLHVLVCSSLISHTCGPVSVVGIATAYGLDGPVIESRWGEIFRTSPDWP